MARKDFSQVAFSVLQQAVGDEEKPSPKTGKRLKLSESGKLGGTARQLALTPEQRSEIASNAAKKRWGKIKQVD
jgi:hypothetical protein